MYLLYSIVYTAAVFILLIPQYLKRPKGLRTRWLQEKFGYINNRFPKEGRPFWIHAVSVGEVKAALTFIRQLRSAYPGCNVLLSTMTDTGQNVALGEAPDGVKVIYMPFDSLIIMKKMMSDINPALLAIVETELWPNIIRAADMHKVPVVLINGRISENSFRNYTGNSLISSFVKRFIDPISLFIMQTVPDAERIKGMGAAEEKVLVSGSFKFDGAGQLRLPEWTEAVHGRTVIVAGSTHPGEEALLIEALKKNLARFPGLLLVLAPRHPERFREVASLIESFGIAYVLRSNIHNAKDRLQEAPILLLDSIGELSSVYGLADIAVIGKSFLGIGGQNPLEPAAWSRPVICGPHMENFPFVSEFYKAGAAFETTPDGLSGQIALLLSDPQQAKEAGEKAHEVYQKNSGAVQKSIEAIKPFTG